MMDRDDEKAAIAAAVQKALVDLCKDGQPTVLVNPTINVQVNYASGGGATVNVGSIVEKDDKPAPVARLMDSWRQCG